MRANFLLLVLAVGLNLVPQSLAAEDLAAPSMQVTGCSGLGAAQGVTLAQDLPGLNPRGARGNPELCLLHYASDDVYKAILRSVDNAATFDAAKQDAISRLPGLGVDLCKLTIWETQGLQAPNLNLDQRLNLPIECQPRLEAADPGAEAFLPAVQTAFAEMIDATAKQTGWRPNRTLVVKVFTDVNVAIPVVNQYILSTLPGETTDSLAQRTRTGASHARLADPTLGYLVLLNLTTPANRTKAGMQFAVAYMYTGFAHTAILGNGNADTWFRQGLDTYQAERNGGSARGFVAIAARGQQQATETTPLTELTTSEKWLAHQRSEGTVPVGARAHAAFVYLVEQYGFDALIQILGQNHNGTLKNFEERLTALTGRDLLDLDATLSQWLAGVSTQTGRGGTDFHVDVTASPGLTYTEIAVTFDRPVTCGADQQVDQGTTATIWSPAQPDGSILATGYLGDAAINVEGSIVDSGISGALQFANPRTGCDTGPLPFG